MPNVPGIPHRRAVAAQIGAGFIIEREGRRHIVMTNGSLTVTIPRHDPVNGYTMGGIVSDAGLSVDEFKRLL